MPGHDPVFDPFDHVARRHDITVVVDAVAEAMGGGFCVVRDGHTVVVLAPHLDGAAAREALTHELVHGERGGGPDRPDSPPSWAAVVSRDEAAVHREVAARLVPHARLRRVVRELLAERDGVDVASVAAAFEVSEPIAELALRALHRAGPPWPGDDAHRRARDRGTR